MSNIEKLKAVARKRVAEKLTHRSDGKKPQLHPDSMWNVLLITELDEIVTSTYLQAVEDCIPYLEQYLDTLDSDYEVNPIQAVNLLYIPPEQSLRNAADRIEAKRKQAEELRQLLQSLKQTN